MGRKFEKVKLQILVSSHSKAYDIWHITEYFFNKYWKNCPFDIFLGANGEDKREYCPNNWKYINNGIDESWSKSLISYLKDINSKYVLLYVDDTIFLDVPDCESLFKILNEIEQNDIKMFRLYPNPEPDIKANSLFGRIDVLSNVPYITSWNNCIWEKNFLVELLKYDFNPWEFEIKAGKTIEAKKNYNKFYSVYKPVINVGMFVEKGKFYPFIKELARKDNIDFDFSKRDFLSKKDLMNMKISMIKSQIYAFIPNKYKNKIRKLIKKDPL